MEIIKTAIEGLLIIKPTVYGDMRGYFFNSYNEKEFREAVGEIHFVQDNESKSHKGVIRGLHFQLPPHAQAKLITCVHGRVLDVAVDLRKDSPTYGRYVTAELSQENHLQFFIPRGFAHGFVALEPDSVIQYKCDNYYAPGMEGGISVYDPDLAIDWKIDQSKAILSEKDKKHPLFKDFISPF